MRVFRFDIACLALLSFCNASAHGEPLHIAGKIIDMTGDAVPYEAVQLRRPYPGGVAAAVQSDANGSFSFTSVTPEELFLTIRIPGYRAISQPLRLGGQQSIDLGTIPLMVTDPDVINYPWEPFVPSQSTFGRTKYTAVSGQDGPPSTKRTGKPRYFVG